MQGARVDDLCAHGQHWWPSELTLHVHVRVCVWVGGNGCGQVVWRLLSVQPGAGGSGKVQNPALTPPPSWSAPSPT
jgi:hypothetical protein